MVKKAEMFFQQVKSLLIMDSVKSHLEYAVDSFKRHKTQCKTIDGSMTPYLQFIDTHVNKPFKHILRER